MPFQKVQYTFPDEEEKNEAIEVEGSNAIEIDISGETKKEKVKVCLLYTSPSPRDGLLSRMPSSA